MRFFRKRVRLGSNDHMEGFQNRRLGLLALALVASALISTAPAVAAPGFQDPGKTQGTTTQAVAGAVKEIIVKGNVVQSKEGILAAMRTKVGQPFSQATLDEDKETLFSLGVFKAEPNLTVKTNDDGSVSITVEVAENPIIKEIRVVGNTVFTAKQILAVVTIKTGQIFSLREAQITGRAIEDMYVKKNYFARVTDLSYLPDSPNTLNIQIQEMTVSTVKVTGATRTKKRVFDHLIKTKPGDPYNSDKWFKDLQRIYNTHWFEGAPKDSADQSVPGQVGLGVAVKEGRTGNFGLGVQVDPQSSFAGFLRYTDTNYNGTGQSVGAGFEQAIRGGGPSVDLNYTNPFIDNHDTQLQFSLYSRVVYRFTNNVFGGSDLTNTSQYIERHTGAMLGFTRPIGTNLTGSVTGRFEGIKTSDIDASTTNQFIQQDGTIGSVAFAIARNRRDTDIDASRGDFLTVRAEPGLSDITKVGGLLTDQSFLGTSSFVKLYGDYRLYLTNQPPRKPQELDAPRRVLAIRMRAGTIAGKIPFFEQNFAGGGDTVRGYDDDRFWGKNTLIFNVEYRHPLQKGFNLILFTDYGGAWGGYGTVNNFYQTDSFRLHLGYGLGLSFRTPLGPIRLDFGINEKGGSRAHFSIGTSF